MFAHYQFALIHADIFWTHDLVRGLMLQHSILMNARLMCEGVRADNRLVGLDNDARVIADELADTRYLCGVNVRIQSKDGMTRLERHDNLFERGISRAFTNPVDGDFCLPRASTDASQCVGCC